MNSNGIRLAEDFDLCRRLAELGVYVILSLNTFDAETSRRLHGRDLTAVKRRAIENLARAGVRMTLLNVLIRGVNEDALADLLELMRQHDHILSLTVQTMTYTGQGGGRFRGHRSRHIPVDEAAEIVCRAVGRMAGAERLHRPARGPSAVLSGLLPAQERRSAAAVRAIRPAGRGARSCWPIRTCSARRWPKISSPTRSTSSMPTARRNIWRRCGGLVERLYPPGRAIDDFERQRLAEAERADDLRPRPHGRRHLRLLAGDALSRPGAGRTGPADPGLHLQPVLPHAGRAVLRRPSRRRRRPSP